MSNLTAYIATETKTVAAQREASALSRSRRFEEMLAARAQQAEQVAEQTRRIRSLNQRIAALLAA